jgi:hypothetical protein
VYGVYLIRIHVILYGIFFCLFGVPCQTPATEALWLLLLLAFDAGGFGPSCLCFVSASFFIGLFHDKPHWDWCVTGSLGYCDWQASGLPNVTSRARAKGNHLTCLLKRSSCTHSQLMHISNTCMLCVFICVHSCS